MTHSGDMAMRLRPTSVRQFWSRCHKDGGAKPGVGELVGVPAVEEPIDWPLTPPKPRLELDAAAVKPRPHGQPTRQAIRHS